MSLITLILIILDVLAWLIIIDVILSYFPSTRYHPLVVLLRRITSPILGVFRAILPPRRMGDAYIDFAPILAIVALWIIRMILRMIIRGPV